MSTSPVLVTREDAPLIFEHALFTAECIPPCPGLTEAACLEEAFLKRNITDAVAPNIAKNKYSPGEFGRILPLEAFTDIRELQTGAKIYRSPVPVEGPTIVPSKKGWAFATFSAGCMTIVLTSQARKKKFFTAAHGSRDGMIDRRLVMTGWRSREHESVVEVMIDAAIREGFAPYELQIFFLFSLPTFAHELDHPDPSFRTYNFRLADYISERYGDGAVTTDGKSIYLSLPNLGAAQARKKGVMDIIIDCTLPEGGIYADTRHPRESMRDKRNPTFVWAR